MADHDKSDALDFIRTEVQRELRRYKRRVQTEAEARYEVLASEAELDGGPINHVALAERAFGETRNLWLGAEPRKAIEVAAS